MRGLGGRVICLEGCEASGKSTLRQALVETLRPRLRSAGGDLVSSREPGGTALGSELRHILLSRPELGLTATDEALLFAVDRELHYRSVVLPAVQTGKTVLMDRSLVTSFVYQSFVGGVPQDELIRLNRTATCGTAVDLCIMLDVTPAECQRRRSAALSRQDVMPLDWHERTYAGYRALIPPADAPDQSQRIPPDLVRQIVWIDACCPPDQVLAQAIGAIAAAFRMPELMSGRVPA